MSFKEELYLISYGFDQNSMELVFKNIPIPKERF